MGRILRYVLPLGPRPFDHRRDLLRQPGEVSVIERLVPFAFSVWPIEPEEPHTLKANGTVSGDHIVDIPESAVNGEFVDSLTRLTGVLSSAEPPRRVPSLGECRFCEITSRDCLDRMTEDSPREGVTGDF